MPTEGEEFATIERPWWKRPTWVISILLFAIFIVSWIIGKTGQTTLPTTALLLIIILFVWTGNWMIQDLKYRTVAVIAANLHGSYNPTSIHSNGDYTVFTIGSILHDLPQKSGDATAVVPTKLFISFGVNKLVLGTLTVACFEELPLEAQELIKTTSYYKPPYLYTEVPAGKNEGVDIEGSGEVRVEASRITSLIKTQNYTISNLQRLISDLGSGAISVVDFLTSAKRLTHEPSFLEKVTDNFRREKGQEGRQYAPG